MDDNDEVDNETEGPVPGGVVGTRWEVPELVAAGAAVASVGLFFGYAVAGVDTGLRLSGLGSETNAYLGITSGTMWIVFTVPLALSVLLAAWWRQTERGTTGRVMSDAVLRRLRPCLLIVAVLAPLTAAAGIARLAENIATFATTVLTPRAASLAESAGICVMAVAVAFVQWLAAGRLLRPAEPMATSEPPFLPG